METVLHTMYVVAIKDSAAWEGDSPAEMSMIGLWNLVVVWLKVSPYGGGSRLIGSCSFHGDTSAYGLCLTGWIHQRT
jgi:hypothetical protein